MDWKTKERRNSKIIDDNNLDNANKNRIAKVNKTKYVKTNYYIKVNNCLYIYVKLVLYINYFIFYLLYMSNTHVK